jgi:hypothetical protein
VVPAAAGADATRYSCAPLSVFIAMFINKTLATTITTAATTEFFLVRNGLRNLVAGFTGSIRFTFALLNKFLLWQKLILRG